MEEKAQINDGNEQGAPEHDRDMDRSMINEVVTYFSRSDRRPRRKKDRSGSEPVKKFDDYYYV